MPWGLTLPRFLPVDDLGVAREAAEAGAEVVRSWFGRIGQAEWKSSAVDPVTAADLESQRAVIAAIGAARPADAILAEEENLGTLSEGRLWVIDPLDGTVNFFHGVPHVAVSVALFEDGAPLVGVVVDVFAGAEYTASIGGGAFCNGEPIRTSTADLGGALVATGYPYDRRDRPQVYTDINALVLAKVQGIRRFGAAALDLAWVAAGKLDGYWETNLGPWDVAAGMLLIEEAGGLITDHHGRRTRLDDTVFVAASASLHPDLLAVVKRALEVEFL